MAFPMASATARNHEAATVTRNHAQRVPALDFTKGALVLIMVLYHWLNYFIGQPEVDIYRYLRFLTPSFIFITGFLISSVYLQKYGAANSRVPKRLAQRGLKILGIFILLNAISSALSSGNPFLPLSIDRLVPVYVTGNVVIRSIGKVASFFVLVPIGYLLILSAGLVIVSWFYKYAFHTAYVLLLVLIFVLYENNLESQNLELLAFGLMGVACGYVPLETIDGLARHKTALTLSYLCYLVAIAIWNVRYPLQIVGVCLSLGLIYIVGANRPEPGTMRRQIALVGRYSLFAYIAQIVLLRLLRSGLSHVDLGAAALAASFVAALCLTIMTVAAVDRARAKASAVNWLYGAVFS